MPLSKDTLLNHPSMAAMRLMANYFDHLLSLDTPNYSVAQIAMRFEPRSVLWAFHTIQSSSFVCFFVCTVTDFSAEKI